MHPKSASEHDCLSFGVNQQAESRQALKKPRGPLSCACCPAVSSKPKANSSYKKEKGWLLLVFVGLTCPLKKQTWQSKGGSQTKTRKQSHVEVPVRGGASSQKPPGPPPKGPEIDSADPVGTRGSQGSSESLRIEGVGIQGVPIRF